MHKTTIRRNNHDKKLHADFMKVKAGLAHAKKEAALKAEDMLLSYIKEVEGNSAAAKAKISKYVKTSPVKSLSMAVSLGFVVGYFLKK